jgi:hypothetical protein
LVFIESAARKSSIRAASPSRICALNLRLKARHSDIVAALRASLTRDAMGDNTGSHTS